ncbi:hypothetical protein LTS18_006987, partial [Coniosporium uncinatum]
MQSSVRSATTRVLIQNALYRYNQGNDTAQNWSRSQTDLSQALDGGNKNGLLLQAVMWPKNETGVSGTASLFNATSDGTFKTIALPYTYPNGSSVYLGDNSTYGFPAWLYPNFTYTESLTDSRPVYDGEVLDADSALLIGPWVLNDTFSLVSLTLPVINNTSNTDILGYLTAVLDGRYISDV